MGILSGRQRLGVAAILLAASALLSRLMGIIRDKIISWQFGAGQEADMYFAAFVVPDIINYLLAGGFVSITIIPLLARAFQKDEPDAWRLFSAIFAFMTLGACLLTGLGEIWAIPLARAVAPGFTIEQTWRLAFFMRIILPGQIFFLSGACFTGLLFLRRQFAVPALSPLIYNGCIILLGLLLPLTGHVSGMTGYCIGVTAGAFLGAFLLPLVVAAKGGLTITAPGLHPGLRRFLLIALPLMLGQTVVMLDEQFLRVFGSMLGEGSVSLLNYARRIAQVPVSLVGQAIAVASYPFLVRLLAEGREEDFARALNSALTAALGLIIPCGLWMITAAGQILGIIFEGGRFGPTETAACAPLAQLLLAPAPVWIIYMVLARAYYAREDTITPALTGTVITIFCIPCYYLLAVPAGAWAIAAVSGASLCVYVAWLAVIWVRRYGSGAFAGLGRLALKTLACSALPLGAAWFILQCPVPEFFNAHRLVSFFYQLCASFTAFCLLFLLAARLVAPDLLAGLWRAIAGKRS